MKDSSLKFYPRYFQWECLHSKKHGCLVRFVRYTDKKRTEAIIAEMDSIRELPGTVPISDLCRTNTEVSK